MPSMQAPQVLHGISKISAEHAMDMHKGIAMTVCSGGSQVG